MGRMSADTQSKVIFLHNSGVPVSKIKKKLQDLCVQKIYLSTSSEISSDMFFSRQEKKAAEKLP